MSTIVYENILEEIDAYELKIRLRETGNEASLEGEIQGKKEKIGVMQENFLGNLKNLNDKMFTIKIWFVNNFGSDENISEICRGIQEKAREYWGNCLDNLNSFQIF